MVALIRTNDTTVTNDSGRFVLQAPRSGAYMLNVRRLGFEPQRLAVSISPERAGRVTSTLIRTVPVLPTVTTTAAERRAYRDVGFDDRMRAGIGYFLTYDQIVRKQATAFGDLLKDAPGVQLLPPAPPQRPGWAVKFETVRLRVISGRRQAAGCVYRESGERTETRRGNGILHRNRSGIT